MQRSARFDVRLLFQSFLTALLVVAVIVALFAFGASLVLAFTWGTGYGIAFVCLLVVGFFTFAFYSEAKKHVRP